MRSVVFLVVVLACGALVGCGKPADGRKPVHPVQGKVLVKGQPAAGAKVVFHALDENGPPAMRPHADVGPDGTFRLTSYTTGDGAPAGEYAVTITWTDQPKSPLEDVGPDRLKGKYVDPKKPFGKVVISSGNNVLDPFEIK